MSGYQEYEVRQMPGTFNPANGLITVGDETQVPFYTIRVTNLPNPDGTVFRALSHGGEALTERGPLGGWLEASTGTYIGEAGDGLADTLTPPEPLLTLRPVAGEMITANVHTQDGGALVVVYQTVSVGASVVTTLVERPDTTPRAYEYEYDGELKQTIYGDVRADGAVDATVWDRVE